MQCTAKCAVRWSHQRWWSTVQSFNVSVFNICVNECIKICLLDKMAGKISTKSTTKPAVRGRPRRNARTVQIEENAINQPTTARNEKPNEDIDSVRIDESSNSGQGLFSVARRPCAKFVLRPFNFFLKNRKIKTHFIIQF